MELFFICFTLLSYGQNIVLFSDFPTPNHFFQRSTIDNTSDVKVEGSFSELTDSILVRVFKNDVLDVEVEAKTINTNGASTFSLNQPIQAGLFNDRFEVFANHQNAFTWMHSADGILVGDAYLIMGQSNAKAAWLYLDDNT